MKLNGSAAYGYARLRELEGTFPQDVGGQILSAERVLFGWGTIPEEAWPNAFVATPVPPELDAIALKLRSSGYMQVRSLDDLKRCLSRGIAVAAAFPVTHGWFTTRDGHIDMPPAEAPTIGTHVVQVLSYSDRTRLVGFQNSWGPDWGNGGFGTLTYDFFRLHLLEASAAVFDNLDRQNIQASRSVKLWGAPTPMGFLHVIELCAGQSDDRIGWAIALQRRGDLRLEDLFVKPKFRRGGTGRSLARSVLALRDMLRIPLIGTVHEVDTRDTIVPIEKLAGGNRFILRTSGLPWGRLELESTVPVWPTTTIFRKAHQRAAKVKKTGAQRLQGDGPQGTRRESALSKYRPKPWRRGPRNGLSRLLASSPVARFGARLMDKIGRLLESNWAHTADWPASVSPLGGFITWRPGGGFIRSSPGRPRGSMRTGSAS